MRYEPIIGLEIHLQLKTQSKMFCSCATYNSTAVPNSTVCPVCTGQPGTLPVLNKTALEAGIKLGLALKCTIAHHSKFDRKNYFYPDLPKAYQISQYDLPVATNGFVEIDVPQNDRPSVRIGITRAHLEEDSAKSFHVGNGATLVDFNRAGTPLLETVTEPDFRSPAEAKAFLQELRLIARYLQVSDADMEKGHMRCDANVSLRVLDDDGNVVGNLFNPKTEIKNLNSFRHVERALAYEINRQTALWEASTPPLISTTRGWNDNEGTTYEQRTKEGASDYRFFPEPDIPSLKLDKLIRDISGRITELPRARRERFISEYRFKSADARQLCDDPLLADFTEHVMSELLQWMQTIPEFDGMTEDAIMAQRDKLARTVSGWILSKLQGLMSEQGLSVSTLPVTPENFAELLILVVTNRLNNTTALTVLDEMLKHGSDPTDIMESKQLGSLSRMDDLADIIARVIEDHPVELARYQAGEHQLIAFFIGMVMKSTQGSADAQTTKNLLLVKLQA